MTPRVVKQVQLDDLKTSDNNEYMEVKKIQLDESNIMQNTLSPKTPGPKIHIQSSVPVQN